MKIPFSGSSVSYHIRGKSQNTRQWIEVVGGLMWDIQQYRSEGTTKKIQNAPRNKCTHGQTLYLYFLSPKPPLWKQRVPTTMIMQSLQVSEIPFSAKSMNRKSGCNIRAKKLSGYREASGTFSTDIQWDFLFLPFKVSHLWWCFTWHKNMRTRERERETVREKQGFFATSPIMLHFARHSPFSASRKQLVWGCQTWPLGVDHFPRTEPTC